MKTFGRTIAKSETSSIGGRLRQAREEAGLTRKALAERASISARTIEHYEAGTTDASVEKISALAEALGASLSWIVTGQTEADKLKGQETKLAPPENVKDGSPLSNRRLIFERILAHLDELRELGIASSPRMANALIADAHNYARYLEVVDLDNLAASRELADVAELRLAPETIGEAKEDEDGGDVEVLPKDEVVQETVERLIDTAVFGMDLYDVEQDDLEEFAERHDIEPENSWFLVGDWENRCDLVQATRKKLRQEKIAGKEPLGSSSLVGSISHR